MMRQAIAERPAVHLKDYSGLARWLPLAPLLAIPIVGTDGEGLSRVVIVMEVIFLAMGMRNPVYLVGALFLSELTVRDYMIDFGGASISARLFITLASVMIVLPHALRRFELGAEARPLLLTGICFATIATLANFIASDPAYVFSFSRYLANGFVALLIIPLAVRTRTDLVQIGTIALVIAVASASAAVLQALSTQGAPLIQLVPNDVTPDGFVEWGNRSLGLAENPIYLTSDLLLVLFPVAGVLIVRAVPERTARYLAGVLVVMVLALLFTQTRSWVIGAGLGLGAMAFALRGRVGREMLLLLVLAALGGWYWAEQSGSRYGLGPSEDSSAATRPVLWSAAAHIAVDYPVLGIGHDDRFLELSPEYADRIDPNLLARQDAGDALGRFLPHNDFLNIWVSFGTPALIIYCVFFWFIGTNFVHAWKRLQDPLLRGLALGGLGAIVAYAVNSSMHNLFDSTLVMWMLAGFSIVLLRLANKKTEPIQEASP